jgi:ketosteroid isomerase-like protein
MEFTTWTIVRCRSQMAGLAVMLTLGASAAGAAEQTATMSLPSELAKVVRAYDEATFHNDVAAYDALVAEDYLLVNSDGSFEDKAEAIRPFSMPGFRIEPYTNEQPLQRVWGDTAVTGGLLQLRWTQDGEHQTRKVRLAHFWTKRDGRWRLTYTQVTRIP